MEIDAEQSYTDGSLTGEALLAASVDLVGARESLGSYQAAQVL
jgi:hypothetical protein